jgi:hypothetical protein
MRMPCGRGQAPVAPAWASAAPHWPRKPVLKARTGKRQRGAVAIQRAPVEASAPAAMTQWTGQGAPQVWSQGWRTIVPPICPPRLRCPHCTSGWLAALHRRVTRGLWWPRMSGWRSWGPGHTTWKEGTGSHSAVRSSPHCPLVNVWHVGPWRLRQA